ncbi:hypothetical protein AURDEDRAFT_77073 [Auricularia subglabra TFB-10046 SS5]|uniref:CxC2-like cysteine cluster KDZ transposase-associated domain-containing protein n=1 Tax=Auricularia subglabra (strain TFB-10046 / SS5) TaxID=717982 RepID=J0WLU5_AURST|nr:hypothetical protein AURDEDRAFT_77073 [Auricularia subglabra TFB-10046 SS5]
MYEHEYDSRFGTICLHCEKADSVVDHTIRYKCFECFQAPPLCKPCILDAHKHAPFHDVHEWTGSYLRKTSLSAGLFPATFIRPGTVISAGALSDFHLLTQTAKINTTVFCTFLRRKTDYWSQEIVKDRAREFFMTFRMYCYLNNLKMNGFDVPRPANELDPGYELSPGSLAVLCPACPQPDINMSPEWQTRDEALR